jgi:hypothetical protein
MVVHSSPSPADQCSMLSADDHGRRSRVLDLEDRLLRFDADPRRLGGDPGRVVGQNSA